MVSHLNEYDLLVIFTGVTLILLLLSLLVVGLLVLLSLLRDMSLTIFLLIIPSQLTLVFSSSPFSITSSVAAMLELVGLKSKLLVCSPEIKIET